VDGDEISVEVVLAEMDELGKAKFNEALAKARLKRALARIEQLERQQKGA